MPLIQLIMSIKFLHHLRSATNRKTIYNAESLLPTRRRAKTLFKISFILDMIFIEGLAASIVI